MRAVAQAVDLGALPSLVQVGDAVQMLLGWPGQHADEDDAVVVNGDNLGDGRVGLRVADENERSRHELTAALDIVDVRVGEAVGVSPVVVNPQVESNFHRDQRTGRKPGFCRPHGVAAFGHTSPDDNDLVGWRILAPQQERSHRWPGASACPRATATASSAASTAWAYTRSVMAGLA